MSSEDSNAAGNPVPPQDTSGNPTPPTGDAFGDNGSVAQPGAANPSSAA